MIQEDVLMSRVAQGDEDSFALLYKMWGRRIMSYAFRELRDVHEAQDVVQDTFMALFKAAPRYKAEGKFPAFVLRIAGNEVRGRCRGKKKMVRQTGSLTEMLEDEAFVYPEELTCTPEDKLIGEIDAERLISVLPTRQREALMMVANGVSYLEGAEILQISKDAFAQLVLRGRRALKSYMMGMSD